MGCSERVAVLKIWVDNNGIVSAGGTAWMPADSGGSFDPDRWLRVRTAREYDEEDIGSLAIPPPPLAQMSTDVSAAYAFLGDLDTDERALAEARERDRPLALRLLADLPGHRLRDVGLH
jgi:hypothetical protein